MHITYISSFVPRKCGIATYTRDLSVEIHKKHIPLSIIAMENVLIPYSYSAPVTKIIRQEKLDDYKKVAQQLNSDPTDIVHLQHEFGLFDGRDGQYILNFASELTKPLIVTFHTVLLTPTENQKYIIQELARLSRNVIVMDEVAKNRLENVYGLNPNDSVFILHGAPIVNIKKPDAKKAINFSDSFVLLANNLISRTKGLEFAIKAVPKAVKEIPNLKFLIVGETHPVVKKTEGESYRKELIDLVKKLHLESQVIFINKYIPLEELQTYLAAADVYITPYLDPQQITSGTLSYAIGAGKACIATEYVYAKDMLAKDRGSLIPFRDSNAIAKALIELYKNPKKLHKLEINVTKLRKNMRWSKVAEKHILLYSKILELKDPQTIVRNFLNKPIDISYLSQLTDAVGIIQHTHHIIPDRKFGYSTDDNARALIVVSQLYKQHKTDDVLKYIKLYVSFLRFAQEPNGKFHTFLNFTGNWDDKTDVTDPYGKAMWALGFNLYLNDDLRFTQSIHSLFTMNLSQIDNIRDLRTAAYTMLGLYYYILKFETKTDTATLATEYLKKLADFLMTAYKKNHTINWNWFEDTVTYDNFRLPQALFAAYMITGNEKYKKVANSTLQFITNCNYNKKRKHFDFIGQDGWYVKGQKKADYDQQPLEAAAAVDAYLFEAQAFHKRDYLKQALLAFEWFFGNNRNHRYIYDKNTRGVFDGLTLKGVNQNEGAESIVCFLISCLSLQHYLKKI
ncbi:MAG: Glycosyltransferase [Candidatus Roizmanbacteria bacterium GW2011_GWA2_32_13]|uniref:Glycosyltransferase n=1 Tax=Candidatus Roizmanbacteria bacterium GW2011_GWA2_32_13 TaxID=1618475 RepID=A0A0G0BTL2_9BACT|nr:MAG: Glycosyltransferase [Candidatus Roizmanbacteria bacterium GW2011_GWA2_32_13]